MIDFIGKKNVFFTISIAITVIGLAFLLFRGLQMDIDFKGGTILEMSIGKDFDNNTIEGIVRNVTGLSGISVVHSTGSTVQKAIVKTEAIAPEKVTQIVDKVKAQYQVTNLPYTTSVVQPIIGNEMKQKGITAIIIASLAILIYVAIRFQSMSGMSAGVTSVIALIHDILIMTSVYSIFQVPVNSSFIAAVLTILGYSINDTIVVYDRIRENQGLLKKVNVRELVNKSINQTLARSINTVVTVLIAILCVFIAGTYFGVKSLTDFTFPLLIGIISGCYSSVCIASPLWVLWRESREKKIVGTVRTAK